MSHHRLSSFRKTYRQVHSVGEGNGPRTVGRVRVTHPFTPCNSPQLCHQKIHPTCASHDANINKYNSIDLSSLEPISFDNSAAASQKDILFQRRVTRAGSIRNDLSTNNVSKSRSSIHGGKYSNNVSSHGNHDKVCRSGSSSVQIYSDRIVRSGFSPVDSKENHKNFVDDIRQDNNGTNHIYNTSVDSSNYQHFISDCNHFEDGETSNFDHTYDTVAAKGGDSNNLSSGIYEHQYDIRHTHSPISAIKNYRQFSNSLDYSSDQDNKHNNNGDSSQSYEILNGTHNIYQCPQHSPGNLFQNLDFTPSNNHHFPNLDQRQIRLGGGQPFNCGSNDYFSTESCMFKRTFPGYPLRADGLSTSKSAASLQHFSSKNKTFDGDKIHPSSAKIVRQNLFSCCRVKAGKENKSLPVLPSQRKTAKKNVLCITLSVLLFLLVSFGAVAATLYLKGEFYQFMFRILFSKNGSMINFPKFIYILQFGVCHQSVRPYNRMLTWNHGTDVLP